MRAGKHVLVEIPVTDSVEDAEALVRIAKGGRRRCQGRARAPLQSQPSMDPQASRKANWPSSRWTFRPISSGARTSMLRATRAAGPTISCGITPRIPSISSSIRPERPSRTVTRCKDPCIRSSAYHGHGHRGQGAVRSHPDAVALVQQRWSAGLVFATYATTAPTRRSTTTSAMERTIASTFRRSMSRWTASSWKIAIHRRHQGEAPAQCQSGPGPSCMRILGKLEHIIDPQRKAHA